MISYDMLYHDVISGLVLTGTIVLAFLVMVCTTLSLEFHFCVYEYILMTSHLLLPRQRCHLSTSFDLIGI